MADPIPEITKLDNGNIEIRLSIPWEKIKSEYQQEVEKHIAESELPGFRKGKAPRELVEPKLDKNDLYSHAIQHLLPDVYAVSVKTHNLKPILYPRVNILKGEENQAWEFLAVTCEAPSVQLPDYKTALADLKISDPNQKLNQILTALRSMSQVKVPDLLVEEEANHRLSNLADNISRLGLDTQTYLQTKKLTPETLKANLASESRTDLEVEFILESIKNIEKLPDRSKTLDYLSQLVK